MTTVTIYALYADDFRKLFLTKAEDDYFYGATSCALALFLFEMIILFAYKPSYRYSFYFWLDFFAVISLVPDIGWI